MCTGCKSNAKSRKLYNIFTHLRDEINYSNDAQIHFIVNFNHNIDAFNTSLRHNILPWWRTKTWSVKCKINCLEVQEAKFLSFINIKMNRDSLFYFTFLPEESMED